MSVASSRARSKAPEAAIKSSAAEEGVKPPSKPPSVAPSASGSSRAPTEHGSTKNVARSQVTVGGGSQTETAHIRQQLSQLEGLLAKERKEREIAAECLAKTQKELDALERILTLRSGGQGGVQ